MAIYAPQRRINPSIQRISHERKSVYSALQLTSMVDMFAIMVIFLLMSFSAEGELVILPKGLELPKASNIGVLERAPSLVLSQDVLLLDTKEVVLMEDIANLDNWYIKELDWALTELKKESEAQAIVDRDLSPEREEDLKKINISIDRRIPFGLVKKVIYTAGHAGFPLYRFSVFAGANPRQIMEEENSEETE